MAVILLVRHGENEWVKKGRLAGWIPGVHLNEKGKEQAVNAAARLAHLPITAVYSSPVTRCLETARPIANTFDLPITPIEAVGEVHYGKWEGKKIKKLAKKPAWYIVQHFPSRHQFPGGESLREVQNRAVTALEQLSQRHNEEIIVVVSHADVIKLLLAHYLGVHLDLFQRIGLSPASVSVIDLNPKGMVRVLRVNDDGPLQLSQPKPIDESKTSPEPDEEE
jgi:probable phosphomutase (TIGR03848 family)